MRYYFFQTVMADRDGEMKPTLRALPKQTFPDGTPVNDNYNVTSPKEKGEYPNGSRFDYPIGTYFCSDLLREVITSNNKHYYSVFQGNPTKGEEVNFHPVSDDNNFQYVSPKHKSVQMNAAFVSFQMFGDQGEDENNQSSENMSDNSSTAAVRYSPADRGKARKPIEGWKPMYDDQIDTEAELIATWMRRFLNEQNVRTMAVRPKVDVTTKAMITNLFNCGETTDTIASRTRFLAVFNEEKMDFNGLSTLSVGPFRWYLGILWTEHQKGADCSAVPRNADNSADVDDAAYIISTELNRQLGTADTYNNPTVLADIKSALQKGWTLDDILEPKVLTSMNSLQTLASSLANGVIPLPERAVNTFGTTLLDTLIANPANKRPKAKDGFEVDETIWRQLLVNIATKTNTILTGPTGTGKTEIVKRLCKQTGTPFTIIPMGSITDPTEQLVGKMDLSPLPGGNVETKYDWADFALAIQRPGVVLLDEINRIPRHGYNILFSVLDGTRQLPAFGAKGTDKRLIDVHPDCIFFATANIGYAGTEELDEAISNRFQPIEMNYLTAATEAQVLCAVTGISKEDATNIAIVAENIRKAKNNQTIEHAVSMRETIQCAKYVKYGFSCEDALEITFLPRFEGGLTAQDNNCERGTVRAMIATRFNKKA